MWEYCTACALRSASPSGACHGGSRLPAPGRAIMSLALATLKELAEFSAPKARGVILEQGRLPHERKLGGLRFGVNGSKRPSYRSP